MSTGFATLASAGSSSASAARVSSAELRELEPGATRRRRRRGSRARPRWSSRRRGCRAGAAGARAAPRRRSSSSSVRAREHARLVEERVDRGVRAGERGGVRARGLRAGAGCPGLEREDRLAPRRRAARGGRTCAGCRTTRGRAARARWRRRPPTTRAGRSRRRRPCSRSRRTRRSRGARSAPSRAARGRARRSGRRSAIGPGGSGRGREGGVRAASGGIAIPRQFGPTSRRAVRADERPAARACRSAPSAPISAKPAEITHSARDAERERLLGRSEDVLSWEADHGEIDDLGHLLDRSEATDAADGLAVAVDRVGRALEVGGQDIAKQLSTDRALAGATRRRPPATARLEERPQRGGRRRVVALVHARAERLRHGDREARPRSRRPRARARSRSRRP